MTPSRLRLIDAMRAISSQLIVLHHLAFYGPMSDNAEDLAPRLMHWLSDHARIAVQVFFVLGGFFAAKSLAPGGFLAVGSPWKLLWKRYVTIGVPFLAALVVSILCAALARELMTHYSIPSAPSITQIFTHALFLQSILGVEELSGGCWYVAIDFQLFALFLACLWLVRSVVGGTERSKLAALVLVVALALASLFYFNRDATWDIWALYFFGSYAMGALAYWAAERKNAVAWLLLMTLVVAATLWFHWRSRIALALVTTLVLGLGRKFDFLHRWPRSEIIAWLGKISYSVFLVHFSVCLLVNSLFSRFVGADPLLNAAGLFIAWGASIAAGAFFYRYVESPVRQWPVR